MVQTINLGRVAFKYEDFTPEQLDALKGEDFPRFTGTIAEYEAVASEIEEGTIVTITDDFDEENLIGADTLRRVADLEEQLENFDGNAVYLTQEEYDALPESKLTDGVEYRITDEGIDGTASNLSYDNSVSGLTATNVQGAVDELKEDVSTLNESLREKAGWLEINSKRDITYKVTLSRNSPCLVMIAGTSTYGVYMVGNAFCIPISEGTSTSGSNNVITVTRLSSTEFTISQNINSAVGINILYNPNVTITVTEV